MSEKDKGADKTEPPTRKRILDARKEGNVSKSRDLTGTVLVMGWLVTAWMLVGSMHSRINNLFEQSLATLGQPFETSLPLLEGARHGLRVKRISQVLSNLLSNAAKYTPPGG